MRKRTVLHVVGALVTLTGLAMFLPAAVGAAFYREAASIPMTGAAAIAVASGWLMNRIAGPAGDISIRDGFAIVTFGWIFVAAFASLPYLLTNSIPSVSQESSRASPGPWKRRTSPATRVPAG